MENSASRKKRKKSISVEDFGISKAMALNRKIFVSDGWKTLLYSEWFIPYLFTYLNFQDIGKLDSAITNHEDKHHWLNHLKTIQLSINLNSKQFRKVLVRQSDFPSSLLQKNVIEQIYSWIMLKKLNISELSLIMKNTFTHTISWLSSSSGSYFDHFMDVVTQNSPSMKKLQLMNCSLSKTTSFSQCLQELTYKGNLPKHMLKALLSSCRLLESLTIHLNYRIPEDFNQKQLCSLLSCNNNLQFVNFCNVQLSGVVFEVLGSKCPKLQHLILTYDNTLQVDGIVEELVIPSKAMMLFTQGCGENLTKLKIQYPVRANFKKLYHYLGQHNVNLESLEIVPHSSASGAVMLLNTETLPYISKQCQKLRDICFSYYNLPTQGLRAMANEGFSIIQKIVLNDCKIADEGWLEIGKLMSLTTLVITGNNTIDDQNVSFLVSNNSKLEHLELSNCSILDEGLKEFGKLKHLKVFIVEFIYGITDKGILNCLERRNLSDLEYIKLNFCSWISNASLFAIANYCPKLKKIEIHNVHKSLYKMKSMESGFWSLFDKCPLLVEISSRTKTSMNASVSFGELETFVSSSHSNQQSNYINNVSKELKKALLKRRKQLSLFTSLSSSAYFTATVNI